MRKVYHFDYTNSSILKTSKSDEDLIFNIEKDLKSKTNKLKIQAKKIYQNEYPEIKFTVSGSKNSIEQFLKEVSPNGCKIEDNTEYEL